MTINTTTAETIAVAALPYDLHLFAKRAWALAPAWGDAGYHRARIAATIGAADG